VPAAAPRIDRRLVATLALVDDKSLPIAEVNRRVGAVARRLGLTKPSYEQVRVLVHANRRRRPMGPGGSDVLLDVTLRSRRPGRLFDRLFRRRPRVRTQVTVCYYVPARSRKSRRMSLKPGAL
jgi:hypothetical protein